MQLPGVVAEYIAEYTSGKITYFFGLRIPDLLYIAHVLKPKELMSWLIDPLIPSGWRHKERP